ncbi:Crp/Fnr family transcriptional regulator [Salegentibacter sp. JZCK2]|uniref:Crp/Fnr family transcriptional regulator n=1 Tax=Salegentibacter tibetensis TaxID=2873600 RepID=UPI001CCC513B|nr:Crp/Fnr family transcriptional regulator [Salegentibacter tibetensis]MBZ9730647.1 Crp/Fnr family transcriptional regulator [Salegentibacter tibetensis]
MVKKSKVWYLENFNFFSELDMEVRTFICQNTIMRSLDKGEVVYFQFDPSNSVYFLKEGKIRISKFAHTGEEFLIGILEKGEIFGESSITASKYRKEAAIVEEKGTYCVMKEEKFKELLLMAPALNLKFSQMLEEKLEKAQKRLQDLSCKNNQQRIIDFLKETAALSSKSHNGELIIDNSLTHQKIAQLTCTNRQEVSSVLSLLKKNKIIDYNRKTIKILKLHALQTS